jgi:hypothetical protein
VNQTQPKTSVTELIDALNARMLNYQLVALKAPTSGFGDERFNGLVECELQLRPEYAALWSSVEAFHASAESSWDTKFLGADQETLTDDAVFWTDAIHDLNRFVALHYVIDPAKTDVMMEYLTSRPQFRIYTDAERADDLTEAKAEADL